VRAEDGVLLQGWHWPAPAGGKHSKITLLQLHGNAGSRHNRLYWVGPTTSLHTLVILLAEAKGLAQMNRIICSPRQQQPPLD